MQGELQHEASAQQRAPSGLKCRLIARENSQDAKCKLLKFPTNSKVTHRVAPSSPPVLDRSVLGGLGFSSVIAFSFSTSKLVVVAMLLLHKRQLFHCQDVLGKELFRSYLYNNQIGHTLKIQITLVHGSIQLVT